MKNTKIRWIIIAIVAVVVIGTVTGAYLMFGRQTGSKETVPTDVPTSVPTSPETEVPTTTEAAGPTAAPTATTSPQETVSPIEVPTPTPEPTPTDTPVPTATSTPTPSPSPTNTPTPTNTPSPTNTPTPEPTATSTPVPTATSTPTPKPTKAPTSTPTPTNTPTPTPEPAFGFVGSVEETMTLTNENPEEIKFKIKNAEGMDNLVIDVYSTNDYAVNAYVEYNEVLGRYTVSLYGQANGTAQIIFRLYGLDENGNKKELYDTKTILVTVKFEDVPVDENASPFADYPYLDYEWQYGDDITVKLWTNGGANDVDDDLKPAAVMVVSGTGAMWDSDTAEEKTGVYGPWNDYSECKYNGFIYELYIEEGVTHIEGLRISSLTSISFPSTLKSIGTGCFRQCKKLTEIVLPEGVETLEDDAFSMCDNVTRIELPSTLKYIGMGALDLDIHLREKNYNKVASVQIPEGVEYIGYGAFGYRWDIEIIVPDGLDTTGFDAEWDIIMS